MKPTVAIDTNCINALRARPALNELESLARDGHIQITATFVLGEELASDNTKAGEARRAKAARLPTGRAGFMIGHSTVGGRDVIGGPDVEAHIPAISAIVAPSKAWADVTPNTQRDIRHLAVHLTYGWDLFVTQDGGILACRELLLSRLGVRVLSPEDAVTNIRVQLAI